MFRPKLNVIQSLKLKKIYRVSIKSFPDYLLTYLLHGAESYIYYDKGYQQMPLSFVIFLYLHVSSLHVSGFYQPIIRGTPAVAYVLPLGSCSA